MKSSLENEGPWGPLHNTDIFIGHNNRGSPQVATAVRVLKEIGFKDVQMADDVTQELYRLWKHPMGTLFSEKEVFEYLHRKGYWFVGEGEPVEGLTYQPLFVRKAMPTAEEILSWKAMPTAEEGSVGSVLA